MYTRKKEHSHGSWFETSNADHVKPMDDRIQPVIDESLNVKSNSKEDPPNKSNQSVLNDMLSMSTIHGVNYLSTGFPIKNR